MALVDPLTNGDYNWNSPPPAPAENPENYGYDYNTGTKNGNEGTNPLSKLKKGVSDFFSKFDPSQARLGLAGLLGGASKVREPTSGVNWLSAGKNQCDVSDSGDENDWRVKISVASGSDILYNSEDNMLMYPIQATNGVIFPITPTIQITHTAKYSSQPLTHSNYAMHFYEGSEVGTIQINAEFPIQNIEEGQYLLAAIYFFRSATKMHWGEDTLAGTPPPMVFLDGYGEYYFPHVPCVVTSFMHTMPEDKDFIEIPSVDTGEDRKTTRLPTQSTLQIVLQPVYSRSFVNEFNVKDFANGDLLGFM